jgi:hypothetical protein
MQAMRIIEVRDHIAREAYAAMRRVEAEAALSRRSRAPREGDQPQQEWREARLTPLGSFAGMSG